MTMGKEPTYTEPAKTPLPLTSAKPLTEEEWEVTVDRLDATKEVFRQNREMRDVLSRREAETRALQTRNAKLEELMLSSPRSSRTRQPRWDWRQEAKSLTPVPIRKRHVTLAMR
jgi:hypothetical protein